MADYESPLFAIPLIEGGSDHPTPDDAADAKDINDAFKYTENFLGAQQITSSTRPALPKQQQLCYETDTKKLIVWSGSAWLEIVSPDSIRGIGGGTSSARDAAWGAPTTAAGRVALAAKEPTWHNTDKHWDEQYFAAITDDGANPALACTVAGWYPVVGAGTPMLIGTLTAALNPAAGYWYIVAGQLTLSAVRGGITRNSDGIFTLPIAGRYEIIVNIPVLTNAAGGTASAKAYVMKNWTGAVSGNTTTISTSSSIVAQSEIAGVTATIRQWLSFTALVDLAAADTLCLILQSYADPQSFQSVRGGRFTVQYIGPANGPVIPL